MRLASWIERNFEDIQAVRDVAANLRFFGSNTASYLDYCLNTQAQRLTPLLVKCWRLIIRHMLTARQGGLRNEWFEIKPRIIRGEVSADLLQRLAEALRPKLRLSKPSRYGDTNDEEPEYPGQLMSIDYEIDDGVRAEAVLSAWPEDAAPETDVKLLSCLTSALSAALEDAIDVRVEGNEGHSISDIDVPSVAKHEQNAYRTGFHAIVRVTAELWERLAKKSPELALPFVEKWRGSQFRLMRRLAVFTCANPVVQPKFAADVLLSLPQGELFLTNSAVEVFRLIRTRWNEFSKSEHESILHRVCEGPPRDWYREGADVDKNVDRDRFDILAEMQRGSFVLSAEAEAVLSDIRSRWPQWQLRSADHAGFSIWHGEVHEIKGNSQKLQGIPESDLVSEAKRLAAAGDFLEGDDWQALCLSEPDRALRGLDAAASAGDWTPELWQQLLWARKEYAEPNTAQRIAELLLQRPADSFVNIASAASSWLNEHVRTLDDALLWPLWDRIADAALVEVEEVPCA